MRLVAINGSYRGSHGHTAHLIERLFEGATERGADCATVHLAKKRIRRCVACGRCQERAGRCVQDQKDDVSAIFESISDADVVIYATPVYVFGMSAVLKTLLERFYAHGNSRDFLVTDSGLFFHAVDRDICSRPFVCLVCSDNLEDRTTRNVVDYFEAFSTFLDAPRVGTLVRNGGFLMGHGEATNRLDGFPAIPKVYEAYRQAGRELASLGRIRWSTQRRANQEVVPVFGFKLLKKLGPFKARMVDKASALEKRAGQDHVK